MRNIQCFLFIIFLFSSCDTTEIPININSHNWKSISELNGIDVWDIKIFNDEIYLAGKDINNKGVIYKSSDGIKWEIFNPLIGDSLNQGVRAIDFYNGELIASSIDKPIYIITKEKITPLTKAITNYVKSMVVDNNNLLVGTINNYYCSYVTLGGIYDVYDSLYTSPYDNSCFHQAGITGINISTFLKDKKSDAILIGNYAFNNHFVTVFINGKIDCYFTEGLSQRDKYFGCHDLIYAGDTLCAAGYAGIKYLDADIWKIYGDSLPNTKDGGTSTATAIAYDDSRRQMYVAGTYIGVAKWEKSSWVLINDGLENSNGYYDFVPNMICFKEVLLLTYGTGKNYKSTLRGVRYYPLK